MCHLMNLSLRTPPRKPSRPRVPLLKLTVDSSNCDPHEPDAAPGVDAPDLAAILATHDVTQVVSEDVNAPLVTIALDEAALAPAVLLLRLPYLERLLEAVRSGIPSEGLAEALRLATSAR